MQRAFIEGILYLYFYLFFHWTMEGLHVAMEDVVEQGLFRGARVGEEGYSLTHLFYADDALFMGEWDDRNIEYLIIIRNCFYLVFGLRINLHKSKLYGVGTSMQ